MACNTRKGTFGHLQHAKRDIRTFATREKGHSDICNTRKGTFGHLQHAKRDIRIFATREKGHSDICNTRKGQHAKRDIRTFATREKGHSDICVNYRPGSALTFQAGSSETVLYDALHYVLKYICFNPLPDDEFWTLPN